MKKRIEILLIVLLIFPVSCTTKQRNSIYKYNKSKESSVSTYTENCKDTNEQEIASLFDKWNQSIESGDTDKVVANYTNGSILLPTLSNQPRITEGEKTDYFQHFLENQPSGKIDFRIISTSCNSAIDSGLYTFTFKKTGESLSARYTFTYKWDGKQWLITSHHSSVMPEK